MKRAEFIELSRKETRRQNLGGILLMVDLAVIGLTGAWLVRYLEFDPFKPANWAVFLAFSVSAALGTVLLTRRIFANPIRCPQCKRQLTAFLAQIVIASGRCGFCGTRILDDADTEP